MFNPTGVAGRLAAAALLLLAAPAAWAQYGGMGGMGGMGAGMGAGMGSNAGSSQSQFQSPRLSFRPWISANGTYSENVSNFNSNVSNSYVGYGGSAGISGGRAFSRTMVAGFYTASYQHYNRGTSLSGMSQVGGVSVAHQASARVSLFASEFAGSSVGGFGYGAAAGAFGGWGTTGSSLFSDLSAGGIGFGDPASNGIVDNEVFSRRVHYTGTSGGVTYQPNLRWSFSGTGTAAFVRRKSSSLSDLNTFSSGAQAGYRVSENTQLSLMYQYGRFSYPNMFGGNHVQQTGVGLRQKLGRQATFDLMLGGYRLDTTQIATFAIDSSIAGLLGQGTTLRIFEGKRYGWSGAASIGRSWRNWAGSVAYNHGVNPGNGVMLAANRDAVVGSLSSSAGRISFGTFGGYYRMTGILQNGAKLQNLSVGGNLGYRVFSDFYLGCSAGYSRYEGVVGTAQWRRFASVHLSWSPEAAAFRF